MRDRACTCLELIVTDRDYITWCFGVICSTRLVHFSKSRPLVSRREPVFVLGNTNRDVIEGQGREADRLRKFRKFDYFFIDGKRSIVFQIRLC